MKFKIKNLRNLNFEKFIELKKMNIVVGKNSSGKSSFLRYFPLLKQSMETNITTPILWYGPYVDFGSFNESRCSYRKSEPIELEFLLEIDRMFINNPILFNNHRYARFFSYDLGKRFDEIQFAIQIDDDNSQKFSIKYEEITVDIHLLENEKIKLYYNGKLIKSSEDYLVIYNPKWDKIMPFSIKYNMKKNVTSKKYYNDELINDFDISSRRYSFGSAYVNKHKEYLIEEIFKVLKSIADTRTYDSTIKETAKRIINFGLFNFIEFLEGNITIPKISKTVKRNLTDNCNGKEYRRKIIEILLLSDINILITAINTFYSLYLGNVDYIAPLRASAERYYRKQPLTIDKIDSKGDNVHTYIDSLSDSELKKLNKWLSTNFKFQIDKSKSNSHNSIYIIDSKTEVRSNMADSGFGFSQIIPIALQLWIINNDESDLPEIYNNGMKNHVHKLLIIEQPELHLHPALQANLIDSMLRVIKASKNNNKNVCFLIETHSETIVNRIYNSISNEIINVNDINIMIFNKNEIGDATVETAIFNEENRIINWPHGFFAPEVY